MKFVTQPFLIVSVFFSFLFLASPAVAAVQQTPSASDPAQAAAQPAAQSADPQSDSSSKPAPSGQEATPAASPQTSADQAAADKAAQNQNKDKNKDKAAQGTNTQGKNAGTSNAGTSNDRLFLALPNFLTLEGSGQVAPLTTAQKFKVVARGAFDKSANPVVRAVCRASARRKTANPVTARAGRVTESALHRPLRMGPSKTS